MRTMFRWTLPLAMLFAGVTVNAQERQVERQPAARAPERSAAVSLRDREFAHCIINGNRNEVEISKFALDRLQNKEVQQFAQKMIDDHSKAIQTFARFDTGATINPSERRVSDPPATTERPVVTRPGEAAPAERRVAVTVDAGGVAKASMDWRQIGDELAAQCLASGKKELGSYQGIEFEKAFLGCQVAAHMHMLDELTVFQRHAGDELRAEIGKAISTTQQHLQMAKKLMNEKKDVEPGESKAKTEATKTTEEKTP